ncbi:MAG: ATP-binding protein [Chlorobiaceae bacterium]
MTFDTTLLANWEWDIATNKMEFSDQIHTILGYHPEEKSAFSGSEGLSACMVKQDHQRLDQAFQKCLSQKSRYSGNFTAIRSAEEHIEIRVECTPFIQGGVVIKLIGTVMEMTMHDFTPSSAEQYGVGSTLTKAQEIELRERDELFRLISDNSIDLLWAYDLQTGKYTYSSPSVTKLCGRTQEEMLHLGLFDVLTPEAAQKAAAELQCRIKAIEEGDELAINSGIYQFDELRKDGSIFQTEVMVALVRDKSGRVTGVVGITRDITDRLKNEQKKREFEKNIYESQKRESIGRIASGIAHELNNTLTPLIAYTEYLMDPHLKSNEQQPLIEVLYSSALTARDLVSQLVDFSLQQSLDFKPLDLDIEINNCEKLIRGFLRDNIKICFRHFNTLPPVRGDAAKIRQIIMNLAANAQDAMPQGGTLTFETMLVRHEEDQPGITKERAGSYVDLIVTDTGTGISPELLPLIYEPFFTTKEFGTASGLGLSSVYGVVKQHHGHIHVDSQPGKGSTFTISLPVFVDSQNKALLPDKENAPRTKPQAIEMPDDYDIAIRHRANQLQAALEAEREAGEMQQRFLTMISHEYRTPLAVISTNLDILELQNPDYRSANSAELSKMRRAVRRLIEVMEISLERGRLYDPRTKAEFRRLQIGPLISSQLEDIRIIWPDRCFNYDDGISEHMVFGDTKYLKTALFNLIDNAQKYSPDNSPIDIVGRIESENVVIMIRNQGHLFDKAEGDKLFEKYVRGAESHNTSGAGIGLWLVREIIEQHSGDVMLEGTQEGIQARVNLPLADYSEFS